MKKKLVALLLAVVFFISALPVSAYDGEYLYNYLELVAEFIRENGLYSSDDDDPIAKAVTALLEQDPALYEQLLTYMLEGYDDRTRHIESQYMGATLQTTNYIGVGVTLTMTEVGGEYLEVTALHPEGGAKRAGLEPGDRLIAVEGTPVSEIEFEQVARTLRDGEPGSFVGVSVTRGERTMELSLERTYLGEPEYSARELEQGVWLMRWTQFRDTELMKDFRETVKQMAQSGAQSLILDLRGNGGGMLDMAFEIVEAFIPEKDVHYLSMGWREDGEIVTEQLLSPGGGLALNQIVVLCDEGTASASEIIMTALCDTGYGVAVGQRTYGKGTAQYEIETPTGSMIILTAFKIYSPTTGDYDFNGLYPFYNVANTEKAVYSPAVRLRQIELGFGSCSDDAENLNEALTALGLMREPAVPYRLGEDTQAAINNLRQINGLDRISGCNAETAALINTMLDVFETRTETRDRQMEKALELARESAKEEPLYTLDEDGGYIYK